jgi:CelD/BcsL family acetyltransferase involved in cellulose biosynthesis
MRPRIQATSLDSFSDAPAWWHQHVSGASHPFAHRIWVETWWRHFGDGRRLLLYACHGADEAPYALVPLFRDANGVLRIVADDVSDCAAVATRTQGPLAATALVEAVMTAVTAALRPGDRFIGRSLPDVATWSSYPAARAAAIDASPVVEARGIPWDRYLAGTRARRRRRAVDRLERLLDTGRVRIRCVSTESDLRPALAVLMAWQQARYTASRIFGGQRREFFLDVSCAMLEASALCLRLLEIDGEPAAAILAFWWGGDEWGYQCGWNPQLGHLAIGQSLLAASIRAAFEEQRGAYRLLRGNEPYKGAWATSDEPVVTIEIGSTTP